MQAIQVCRSRFQPLEQLSQPYVMVGLNAFAAATDEEARYLKTSAQQLILNLRRGQPGRLPPPVADFESQLTPPELAMLNASHTCSVTGSPETVRKGLDVLNAQTETDEIMVSSHIYAPTARLRSFEIMADVMSG